MRSFFKTTLLLLLPALVFPGISRAQENMGEDALLHMGPVVVHPSLSLTEKYTDNVFASETDTKSDFITSIAPGLALVLPFSRNELSLSAGANIQKYSEHSSEDNTPYQFGVYGSFFLGDRINLKLGDTYNRNYETPMTSPSGLMEENTVNAPAISFNYSFVDVAKLRLDYTRKTMDYPDSNYRTRDEDLMSAFLYYRVLPATSAFVEYDLKKVAYDTADTLDSDVMGGSLGLAWEISEYTLGTVKAGYANKDFKAGSQGDFSTWTASVDLRNKLTDLASVSLTGSRDVNEGKYADMRYMTSTGLYATFTYQFLDRLSGVLRGSYAMDEYSDAQAGSDLKREDKTGGFGFGARYSFNDWVSVALDYGYSDRDSNIAGLDMAEHTVALSVTGYR